MRVSFRGVAVTLAVCAGLFAGTTARADDLTDALDAPITLVFENTDLRAVLKHINELRDVNIVVDARVTPVAGAAASAQNHVTDGKIQYVNMKDVSLREGLKAVLTPLGLEFSIQDNYIWISSPEHIRHEDLETRVYQIDEKSFEERNAALRKMGRPEIDLGSLIFFIRPLFPMIIEPVTGELQSYARFNLLTKQLVVRNTPTNHKQIKQTLDLLFQSGEGIGVENSDRSGATEVPPAPPA